MFLNLNFYFDVLCLFENVSLWVYPLFSLIVLVFAFKGLVSLFLLFIFVKTLLTFRYSSLLRVLRLFSVILISILVLTCFSSYLICFYNNFISLFSLVLQEVLSFYLKLNLNWVDFSFSLSGLLTPFFTETYAFFVSPSYFRKSLSYSLRTFSKMRTLNKRRFKFKANIECAPDLGKHDPEILSIFVGMLLGNAFLVPTENGVRVAFDTRSAVLEQVYFQEDDKGSYDFELYNKLVALQRFTQHEGILTIWEILKERGYCSTVAPSVELEVDSPRGKMIHTSFETYPLKDLDFLFQMFYLGSNGLPEMGFLGLQKRVPAYEDLFNYFTPLSFAFFFSECAHLTDEGYKLLTYEFKSEEVCNLCDFLTERFGLDCEVKEDLFSYGLQRHLCSIVIAPASTEKLKALVEHYVRFEC